MKVVPSSAMRTEGFHKKPPSRPTNSANVQRAVKARISRPLEAYI